MNTKVSNMLSPRTARPVANQFIIQGATLQQPEDTYTGTMFQSYSSNIAFEARECGNTGNIYPVKIFLDQTYWDHSVTMGKYRNEFLAEGITQTRKKIKSGEYKLVNLNE